jgi:hypothetical protein
MNLQKLEALGFDRSANTFGRENLLSVACSQCQSMVVNGVPCHESGCPNERSEVECRECGTEFVQESRWDTTCCHTCHVAYTTAYCDCDECSPDWDELEDQDDV